MSVTRAEAVREAEVSALHGHAQAPDESHPQRLMQGPMQGHAHAANDGEDNAFADAAMPSAPSLLQWLGAYEARIAAAASRSAQRQCERLQLPFTSGARRAWYAARALWLGPPVAVSAFVPRANRLALLDGTALRRVLAARAIYSSRGVLRRIVSGATRRALSDVLGEHACAVLTQAGVNACDADAALAADLSVDALAHAGYALLERDDAFTLAPARTLIHLELEADVARDDAAPSSDPYESADFLLACGALFPELTWLFG
ncbi:hypothetical protein EN871_24065 [bacterium M00.F.Ca.ET.228.01.1.1]|uniref:type III secretion protein HrpB4 n=1 Tax=Paraburkholderia phenoliruptrix TaxID=252970 RepID=UPI00109237F8|nr:type III secretion protein HrpB4 [Paraburkholderia phenoliruptrix]TGP41530.1 hypothetical protein EN871_24065 [bacterium M00.F.Ca.ET.228.01.1.1]TGR98188.1 hypothetical protein EN834_23680 [bacterium M00.F.Ca.ET.191.01.1.1]TGU02379.1 hypothetical protein EN798_24500 [bacterium M00.F.Ca.ET.155.01.1.1]MBW0447182.1 hypothetical protein [Paraburkholderia phenoliruptrix]MBW9101435.1 hypothetical protein [Paraburkholderia phenoliruptrix]